MPPTRSAASPSFVRQAPLLLALTFSRPTLAQIEEPAPGNIDPIEEEVEATNAEQPRPLGRGESTEPPRRELATRVQVNSVGSALSSTSLERMLGPALKSTFNLRFYRADQFEPADLFRVRTGSSARIFVWVDTRASGIARIYFANRDGTRYLVRDLKLSRPLDEMDREAISQTIEWSLQALSEGTAGMTRAEAEALLSEPLEEESVPAPPPPASADPAPTWRRTSKGWLPEVTLLHNWTPHSEDLLTTQGPVLRLGVDHLSARHQFGITTSVVYLYPQRHAAEGVALELETVGARLGARYLALGLAQGTGLGLRVEFGLDVVKASPEALDWGRFEAAGRSRAMVPLLDTGLVWQLRAEKGVRFETSLGVEVDFVEVMYDVTTDAGTQTLLSRWPVRPSLRIGVALF